MASNVRLSVGNSVSASTRVRSGWRCRAVQRQLVTAAWGREQNSYATNSAGRITAIGLERTASRTTRTVSACRSLHWLAVDAASAHSHARNDKIIKISDTKSLRAESQATTSVWIG